MPLVLITGAARRIGRGMAIGFASKGWDVSIHYNASVIEANQTLSDVSKFDVNSRLYSANLISEVECNRLIDEVVSLQGFPDLTINNAAVYPAKADLTDISLERWDETININVRAAFLLAKRLYSVSEAEFRIINFASLGGVEVWKNRIDYNVSKAAMVQLTKALALNLAPRVQVNCIAPGVIDIPNEHGVEEINISKDKIPMKRYGNTEDIFDAVWFLANCSKYITGQIISVDGGFHLVK